MRNKLLLILGLIIALGGFSSCRMRDQRGAGFHYWNNSGRTSHHWGEKGRTNGRHRFWGRHRYGPRPYKNRGHFRAPTGM